MARLLVESTSAQAAQEHAKCLFERCQKALEDHPSWKKRTLLMRFDQPPVTVLRGKSRWQVLFKLLVHPDTEPLTAFLTELAREEAPGAETIFEYNPTNMM